MKLVSCIMPTRARPEFAQQAIECFLSQTYEHKELIILDDEDAPSFRYADLPLWPGVYYERGARRSIGTKRNVCCELAHSDIIMHWDDDDWSDPRRLEDQVRLLERSGKSVVGYSTALCTDEAGQWARWVNRTGCDYAMGTTLAYYKSWWKDHPFGEGFRGIGEDNNFITEARSFDEFVSDPGRNMIVVRIHSGTTSPKDVGWYDPIDMNSIPKSYLEVCNRVV